MAARAVGQQGSDRAAGHRAAGYRSRHASEDDRRCQGRCGEAAL